MKKVILYTDGGSRGNPGNAAYGAVIYDEEGNDLKTLSKFLGKTTNNQAEYQGLHAGLEACVQLKADVVECRLDSELIVKQMKGEYRVKDPGLAVWHRRVKELLKNFQSVVFHHVRREKNKVADRLVNEALDANI
jgi:ribonuclease HI